MMTMKRALRARSLRKQLLRGSMWLAGFFAFGLSAWALTDLTTVRAVDGTIMNTIGGHFSQGSLTQQVTGGDPAGAFNRAFEHGDELFQAKFNAADGSGANVGKEM